MSAEMVRLEFNLDPTEWHRTAVERVWARKAPTGDGTLLLELQNSPIHARGVSYLDGFHFTYRLLVDWPSPTFEAAWARLERHSCTYESGYIRGRKIFAVDVPPCADIHAVYR